jgi:hypothetical protein
MIQQPSSTASGKSSLRYVIELIPSAGLRLLQQTVMLRASPLKELAWLVYRTLLPICSLARPMSMGSARIASGDTTQEPERHR